MVTIEVYLKMRNNGKSLEEIQKENALSEGTAYTLELGYQCYLKKLSLDKAIKIIQKV
ncbi:hypothetical protein [Mesobacillus zeae]|uniref:hypothetical protein n=1 Tax=Mesobacillus zeae TaxID=1917180 RepID=UPI0015E6BAAD|nr:hypothetical protein [Mesobacillus zeae]